MTISQRARILRYLPNHRRQKKDNIYLIDADAMGHLDRGNSAQVVQAVGGLIFSLALWARPDSTYVYLRETDSSLKAFRVTGRVFNPNPVSISSPAGGTARVGMAISANGDQDGTGILWVTTGDYRDPPIRHPVRLRCVGPVQRTAEQCPAFRRSPHGFAKFVTAHGGERKVYAASSTQWQSTVCCSRRTKPLAPPVIAAVQNSASDGPVAISPGELISIFGANLGPAYAALRHRTMPET